jgi:CHAT domain-containing protein
LKVAETGDCPKALLAEGEERIHTLIATIKEIRHKVAADSFSEPETITVMEWFPPTYPHLHFATHGRWDNFSSSDGTLTAEEIMQLDLRNTELVTLSTCETASGDLAAHDEATTCDETEDDDNSAPQ